MEDVILKISLGDLYDMLDYFYSRGFDMGNISNNTVDVREDFMSIYESYLDDISKMIIK